MPKKIRTLLTLAILVYFSIFAFALLSRSWIFAFGWFFSGLFALDCYWPAFDLEGFTFYKGSAKKKRVSLTFDDGPDPRVTPLILEALKKHGVKATFFILGKFARLSPEIVRRIHEEGHEIASHGYSHQKYLYLGPKKIEQDLLEWERTVLPLVPNLSKPLWMRTPHGLKHHWVRKILRKLDYRLAAWTRGVWDTDQPGMDVIVDRATKNVSPGEVLLFHDGDGSGAYADRSQTAAAIPAIIEKLKQEGFEFVTLSELRQDAPSATSWGKIVFAFAWLFFIAKFVHGHFDIRQIQDSVLHIAFTWLALSLLFDICCLFCKSQAWRQMVFPLKEMPVRQSFLFYLVGAMLNQVLPLRGGDVGRSDLLGRNFEIPRLHGYSTVLLEMLLNGLSLVPILLVALFFFPIQPELAQKLYYFSGVVSLIGAVAYGISKKSAHPWLKGFEAFQQKKRFAYAFAFMLLSWVFYLGALTAMLRAMNIEVSFWAAPILGVFLAASMVIPAPPGRLGTFEATICLALAMFGVSKERALGFAVVLHLCQTLPTLLWGSLAMLSVQKTKNPN